MKHLALRFLIPLGLLAALFSVIALYRTYNESQRYVTNALAQQAMLALEFNVAIRDYAADHIRPAFQKKVGKDEFDPETMSTSYIARSVFESVRGKFPGLIIRFASDNPRNPINAASPDELRMIDYFRHNPKVDRKMESIKIDGKPYMAFFAPKWLTPPCMRCHGDPKTAPADLIKRYGATASFHRTLGDIAALDVVAVPMAELNAELTKNTVQQSLVRICFLLIICLSIAVLFHYVVARRLVAMARHVRAMGENLAPARLLPMAISGDDEIAALGTSFNNMVGQIRQSQELLEDRVRQRTEELAQSNDVLHREMAERRKAEEERKRLEAQIQQAQKLESLGVLAGGIAHDFNNVLMIVLGNAQMALADIPQGTDGREYLEQIEAAAERAAALCSQMLAYAGKRSFATRPLNLSHLVREMSKMLQVSVSKKATLTCDIPEDLPLIAADADQIRQIVMNLIINASDSLGDRNGSITVSVSKRYCEQAFLEQTHLGKDIAAGHYVSLRVADTGCGMTPETLARIFDPFFTTKFTGRGLGLAAVLGIVRAHGGTLWVSSEVGQGTAFEILLPPTDDAPDEQETADGNLPNWQGSGTVLLVDDEKDARDIAQRMLERIGFTVLTADDGRAALRLFEERRAEITCVLLDLTMPEMDGHETLVELRRVCEDVPVVIASGYAEQEVALRFQDEAINGFLQKPYGLGQIAQVLRRLLDPQDEAAISTNPSRS